MSNEVVAVSRDDLSLDALVDANGSLVKFQREPFPMSLLSPWCFGFLACATIPVAPVGVEVHQWLGRKQALARFFCMENPSQSISYPYAIPAKNIRLVPIL